MYIPFKFEFDLIFGVICLIEFQTVKFCYILQATFDWLSCSNLLPHYNLSFAGEYADGQTDMMSPSAAEAVRISFHHVFSLLSPDFVSLCRVTSTPAI